MKDDIFKIKRIQNYLSSENNPQKEFLFHRVVFLEDNFPIQFLEDNFPEKEIGERKYFGENNSSNLPKATCYTPHHASLLQIEAVKNTRHLDPSCGDASGRP